MSQYDLVLSHSAQTFGQFLDGGLHLDFLQGHPDVVVGIAVEGIQVVAEGALEDDRVLWDDGDFGTQVVETWKERMGVNVG